MEKSICGILNGSVVFYKFFGGLNRARGGESFIRRKSLLCRMYKRGQIAVFLVIGILVLGLFAGIFFIVKESREGELRDQTISSLGAVEVQSQVKLFVEKCMRDVAEPGLYLLGVQGGVIYPDYSTVLVTETSIINYAYLRGVDQLSLSSMGEQLDLYMEKNLPACLDFSHFKAQGLEITTEEMNSDSTIAGDKVIFLLRYPVRVEKGDDVVNFDVFQIDLRIPFGRIIEEAQAVNQQYRQNPSKIPDAAGYFLSSFPFNGETMVFSLTDEKISGAPLVFIFAVDANELNTAPEFTEVGDFVLRQGEPFSLRLVAIDHQGDDLVYSSSNADVPVDVDGVLTFTPTKTGTKIVTIIARDPGGLSDSQDVTFKVIE